MEIAVAPIDTTEVLCSSSCVALKHDPEKWEPVFSKKIMLEQQPEARRRFDPEPSRFRKHQMRTAMTVALTAGLLFVQNGRVEAAQTCISKATESLPRIAGLVVKKSRTRPVSSEILSTWKGQTRPVIVDVDFEAAGEAQTYSYMCVITQGSAFVQRTMN
jgi:hypothetical protein